MASMLAPKLTDERNTRSREATLCLGAGTEGVVRSHRVMRDGHIRNSVLYSLIRPEWPQARQALEARLAGA